MERSTRQRSAIRQVIDEAHRPLSPPEVLALAQQQVAALGMATASAQVRCVSSCKAEFSQAWGLAPKIPSMLRLLLVR